jgi:hypothetical protein
VAGEEAVDETHLVDDEESKGDAQDSGGDGQAAVEPLPALANVVKSRGHAEGDEHHAGDGADAEEEEVGDGPMGIVDGGEDEESYGGGAGQTVDEADDERPSPLVERPSSEFAIGEGHGGIGAAVGVGLVRRGMGVLWGGGLSLPLELTVEADQIEGAEQNEHEADGELHRQTEAGRDDQGEEDDSRSDGEDSDGVADAPEGADDGCASEPFFAGDDGGDGDDVVGVGGVAHAEEEAERKDSDEAYRRGGHDDGGYQEQEGRPWRCQLRVGCVDCQVEASALLSSSRRLLTESVHPTPCQLNERFLYPPLACRLLPCALVLTFLGAGAKILWLLVFGVTSNDGRSRPARLQGLSAHESAMSCETRASRYC